MDKKIIHVINEDPHLDLSHTLTKTFINQIQKMIINVISHNFNNANIISVLPFLVLHAVWRFHFHLFCANF